MTDAPLVTIVSGLPRSGTSMMMQMVAAGGVTPHTDGARAAPTPSAATDARCRCTAATCAPSDVIDSRCGRGACPQRS